jgi:hypothetical protein
MRKILIVAVMLSGCYLSHADDDDCDADAGSGIDALVEPCSPEPERCDDGVDNDCDGQIDCGDEACICYCHGWCP